MKIWIYIRTNYYRVGGKTLRQKISETGHDKGCQKHFGICLGGAGASLYTSRLWWHGSSHQQCQQHLGHSASPGSPYPASHMTSQFPEVGHTLWQGDDLGYADGVGGGACLQMSHPAGNGGNYLKKTLASPWGKRSGCVGVPYCQRGFTYVNPERCLPSSRLGLWGRFPLELGRACSISLLHHCSKLGGYTGRPLVTLPWCFEGIYQLCSSLAFQWKLHCPCNGWWQSIPAMPLSHTDPFQTSLKDTEEPIACGFLKADENPDWCSVRWRENTQNFLT